MTTKNKDEGSLTAPEYEAIYLVLSEYVRCICKNKISDSHYVSDVRKAKLPQICHIINKMRHRMEVEYPNDWV